MQSQAVYEDNKIRWEILKKYVISSQEYYADLYYSTLLSAEDVEEFNVGHFGKT